MHPDEFEPFKHKVNFRIHAAGMPHGHTSYRLNDYDNDVLLELAKDRSIRVKRVLARNSRAPVAALELLAKSKSRIILENLLGNSKTPTDLIRKVIKSLNQLNNSPFNFYVFSRTIRNPNCPADVIQLFGDSVERWDREELYAHLASSPNGGYYTVLQRREV